MKKAIALTAGLILLAGCAARANYENVLNSWVGATELDLVRKWGVPQQSYETGGRKFLVYSSSRNMILPGSPPTYTTTVVGNTVYKNRVGGIPDQYMELNCKTTFELENEKVLSWRWQGNDCTAPE
jgi:hypothetical protein